MIIDEGTKKIKMRIAILGSKGIPASTAHGGGVESYIEELAVRLVERGHRVSVYCRPYANPEGRKRYRGVDLITLPTVNRKNLDTWFATLFATLHVLWQPVDIVHYQGVGPSTFSWIVRLFKPSAKVVVTFHSRDRYHEKWSWFGRAYLAFGEWTAVTFPHLTITPSHVIQVFCRHMFGKEIKHVPNAVNVPELRVGTTVLKDLGLTPSEYFFTLSRLLPLKALEDVIHAFHKVKTDKRLVIIGDATPDMHWYEEKLHALAAHDLRIMFVGRRSGHELQQLIAHSYAMVHSSRTEGLSLAILEAMSYAKLVIMSDIPANRELIDHSGIAYPLGDTDALADVLQVVVEDKAMVELRAQRAREVIKRLYSWDSVIVRMEYEFQKLIK
ncbi:glycosyltransferase family 4 protein [Candidatus Uhrbacteria bacterium]|nr:glycosyltransferase family 4 protein [Candidatus Uhrbacteria bacterium]